MVERSKSPPWDRNFRKPKVTLPPGSCDCHIHIIGPQKRFPLIPGHVFDHLWFEDTTLDDWVAMQDAMGLSRGLHTLSMMYGQGYEILLHSLMRFPDRLRGVMMPAPDITDGELEILTKAGVVGTRWVRRQFPMVDDRMVHRTHEFGWKPHYNIRGAEQIGLWRDSILGSPGEFIIEHTGNPPADQGIDTPEFRFVLDCLDTGRCWLKLSPRFSMQEELPFADTLPFIRKLVETVPERLMWGSDWPHVQYFKPMPNDADLVDMLLDWMPDQATLKMILVDNPGKLFGFPPI